VEFNSVEVVYFAVLWLLSFIAGISRTVRDHAYKCCWDCISIGMVGGFYGFSTVTILGHYGPSIATFGWGYIGLAVIVGSLGKEQDKIMRWLFIRLLEKLTGSKYEEDKNEEPKP
jgi:hypothetical protein